MKTAVIGAGSWGTALALVLAGQGHDVALWARGEAFTEQLKRERENTTYLPGTKLPDSIFPTHDFSDCLDASIVLLVPPSVALRSIVAEMAGAGFSANSILASCTKGIERDSGKRMTEIISEYFPHHPVAVLSGPSHAEEVARQRPTCVVLGSADHGVAVDLQKAISGCAFRAYTSNDVAGIELGGALKNIFAIAAGVSDGLGLGDNTKAALVTRALAEMVRLGVSLGGRPETFQGLSGIGDLMVTCFSQHSRNRRFGERIARGETLADISSSTKMVAEGVPTTRSAYQCARQANIQTPIVDEIYSILYNNARPGEAMRRLLARDPRPERDSE
ncbi:MAG TPA: NAD(P)H-dependent glycerol-3-phosphate dehydrogenase [Chthoniobacterales bacterium]|jgi:glycerol-3-phosphate dehydrogenase (NAD(P)+)